MCESECLRFGTTNILFEVWVSETYALWVYDFPNFEVDNFRKKYEFWHSELLRFTNFKGPNFCDLRSLRFRISEIQNFEITNRDSVEKCLPTYQSTVDRRQTGRIRVFRSHVFSYSLLSKVHVQLCTVLRWINRMHFNFSEKDEHKQLR